MTISERVWETTVKANLANGCVHQHIEGPNYGIMSIEDKNGRKAIWSFNKKTGEIKLKGA